MKRGFVACSECGDPVPIAGPDDRRAGVMCLPCAEGPDEITVIHYVVGADPAAVKVLGRLEEFQRLVGGYIELLSLGNDIYLVCNEDGDREGLRPNRIVNGHAIVGNCFVTAVTNSFHRSLTDDEISAVLTLLDGTGVSHGV